jgi:hypothetical protein
MYGSPGQDRWSARASASLEVSERPTAINGPLGHVSRRSRSYHAAVEDDDWQGLDPHEPNTEQEGEHERYGW